MNNNASLPNDGTVTITRSRYEKYQQAEIELERLQALSLAPQPDAAPADQNWKKVYDWFVQNCSEPNPETGEAFSADAREAVKALCALLPASPLPADDVVERIADAIDQARYQHPDHYRDRPHSFADASDQDREYSTRLARAALAAVNLLRQSASVELGEYQQDRSKECNELRRKLRARLLEIGDESLTDLYYNTGALSKYEAARHALIRALPASPPADVAVMREKIENIIFNRLFLAIDTAERGDLTRAAKESADAILALLPTDAAVKALVEALNELNASAGSFRSIMALKWIEMMPQEAVVRFDTARAKARATLAQHGHK